MKSFISVYTLEKNWSAQVSDTVAEMLVWNNTAERYKQMEIPTSENSKSLRLFE